MDQNRRILVIDDNLNIHEDFRKILAPPNDSDSLSQARAALCGEAPTLPPQVGYELDFASQGREGFGLAQDAHQKGHSYAVAFVEMRMPPGWYGLETIEHLWYADPDIHIVICSAYSDHPWEEVSRRIGETDKLLISMKPFHRIKVVQQANALTKKWNLAHSVKLQIDSLASASAGGQPNCGKRKNACKKILPAVRRKLSRQPQDEAMEAFRRKEEFLAIMSHEIFVPMNELVNKARCCSVACSILNSGDKRQLYSDAHKMS